jgi:hypothetical protein
MRRILLALAMLLALRTSWAPTGHARDWDGSERQGHLALGLTGGSRNRSVSWAAT